MFEAIAAFWADYGNVLIEGTWESLIMVFLSTILAYVIGVPLGVALIVTQPQGIRPHRTVYGVLGWIVNIGRSLPFAILLVALMPYTRLIVGTAIGVKGAIPPLVISAAPFILCAHPVRVCARTDKDTPAGTPTGMPFQDMGGVV